MAYTTIDDPSVYFQTTLYTGDGNSSQAQTNTGNSDLQPDWVWIKKRAGGSARSHGLYDSSRGVTKLLHSDSADQESTQSAGLTAFSSDGFTVGDDDGIGANTATYVAWQWKANGGSRTTFTESGTNPGGGRQVNTTAGFSIVDYTGTVASGASGSGTIAHGLGVTPDLYIIKKRGTTTGHWFTYTTIFDGSLDRFILNLTSAKADDSNTAPSSTIITSDNGSTNNTMVCYAFKMHQGFSRFGFYQGNGESTNGTYVHTGFTPSWVMTKRSDNTQNWEIYDRKRSPLNDGNNERLRANLSNAEDSQNGCDFYANGFKWRNNNDSKNTNGATYLYLAFAESPFVNSSGVPTNSR